MPATSAQFRIGTEKNPDAGISLNYDDDDYSQGYGQNEDAFRALTKDNMLQPNISDHDFRSSKVRSDDFGYNLHVFDIPCQDNITVAQPNKVEIKLDGVVPNDMNAFALVLTNKLVSVSSHGQRHFDLI